MMGKLTHIVNFTNSFYVKFLGNFLLTKKYKYKLYLKNTFVLKSCLLNVGEIDPKARVFLKIPMKQQLVDDDGRVDRFVASTHVLLLPRVDGWNVLQYNAYRNVRWDV